MAKATFKINRGGLREYLLSNDVYPALDDVATRIEARAKAGARVETAESAEEHDRAPGKFRDSIHREHHRGPSRVTAQVVADCDGAEAIEARDRTLGKAVG